METCEEGAVRGVDEVDELRQRVMAMRPETLAIAELIVRDRALADDVAQEALVKAWLKVAEIREPDRLGPWVRQIARNTAVDALRRIERTSPIDPAHLANRQSDSLSDPLERAMDAGLTAALLEAFEQLSASSREVLQLRILDELSYGEICDVLQLPLPTVRTRLMRSRRLLATSLRDWN